MSPADIMFTVEDTTIQLERARAVLREAERHFEQMIEPGTWQADMAIRQREHVLMLIQVTDILLMGTIPEFNNVATALLELNKQQNKEDKPA